MKNTVITIFLLLGCSAFADSYFIRDAKLTGVGKDDAATINELVRTSVESLHNQVVESEKDAKYSLRPRILKLGNAYVLTIDKAEGGKSVYTSQMKAERFEELDNVVNRVVRSVVKEIPIADNGKVSDVTEHEAVQGTRRKDTVNRWYFGMGPAFATHVNSTRTLFNFALGYYFEIDPEWALKIVYDGTGGRFGYLALGANYYFKDTKTTPIVTAELGYGSATIDTGSFIKSESVDGFVVGAGAGYQFFRTSKVNVEILLHGGVILGSNYLGTPTKYGLRVGLYW